MRKMMLSSLLLLMIMCVHKLSAQEAFNFETSLSQSIKIPNSPEASAFIKYGDIPVNLYTGSPTISVPIYQIQGKQLSVPITMSYDASGIKVNQLASWVGLGWNLNYGGVVTRQVNGLADQGQGTYGRITDQATQQGLNAAYESPRFTGFENPIERTAANDLLEAYRLNTIDTQYDTFSFQANGLSGTIGINYTTGNAFSIEDPTLKVTYIGDLDSEIRGWIITDGQGIVYTFEKKEYTKVSFYDPSNENTITYVSAWYLTKIAAPYEDDVIKYIYSEGAYYQQNQALVEEETIEGYYDPISSRFEQTFKKNPRQTGYRIRQFDLVAITYNDKPLLTTSIGDRADLQGRSSLTGISIRSDQGRLIKDIEFEYSYFTASLASSPSLEIDKRLKLDAIVFKETPIGETVSINQEEERLSQRYSFAYDGIDQLPRRNSKAMDLWGYYNGSDPNRFVTGNQEVFNEQYGVQINESILSNRKAIYEAVKIGTLTSITYPTGGTSTFHYQLHKGKKEGTVSLREYYAELTGGNNGVIRENLNSCQELDDIGLESYYQNSKEERLVINSLNADRPINFRVNYTPNTTSPIPGENDLKFICVYKTDFGTNTCETRDCPPNSIGIQPFGCSRDIDGDTYEYCDNDRPAKTYCEIMSNDPFNNPNILFIDQNAGQDFTLTLPVGDYRILMINGYDYSRLNIAYKLRKEQDKNNEVGGLRIAKIESSPEENSEEKLTKYYYYGDINEIEGEITPEIVENQQNSSGLIHQKLMFSSREPYLYTRDEQEAQEVYKYKFYSSNLAPITKQAIAYTTVSELRFKENVFQGSTVHTFYNTDEGEIITYKPFVSRYHLNGKPKSTVHYNDRLEKVAEEQSIYEQLTLESNLPYQGVFMIPQEGYSNACIVKTDDPINGIYQLTTHTTPYNICAGEARSFVQTYQANRYRLKTYWSRLKEQKSINYFDTETVESNVNYAYEASGIEKHYQVVSQERIDSDDQVLKTVYKYPLDKEESELSKAEERLIINNSIAIPLLIKNYIIRSNENEELLAAQKNLYEVFDDNEARLSKIQTAKREDALEDRMHYKKYDDRGNPLEVTQTAGVSSIYVWGYNGQYPLAKIENASYDGMPIALQEQITVLQTQSNTENTIAEQTALRAALEGLRNHDYFAKSFITTYTYDPLIGVTSITDPKGYSMTYHYDAFNRLHYVKDAQGNLISENQYHYKINQE